MSGSNILIPSFSFLSLTYKHDCWRTFTEGMLVCRILDTWRNLIIWFSLFNFLSGCGYEIQSYGEVLYSVFQFESFSFSRSFSLNGSCSCSEDESFASKMLWRTSLSSLNLSSILELSYDSPPYVVMVLHCSFGLTIVSLRNVLCAFPANCLEIYSSWISKFWRENLVCYMNFSRVASSDDILDSNMISSKT